MLAKYVAAGFAPEGFWHITPREFDAHLKGARMRLEREFNERAWLAWHSGAFSQCKPDPSQLEKIMIGPKKQREPEPWQAQLAKWQAYIASVSK